MCFTQTRKQAHRLHILLGLIGLKVGELHGELSQSQRLENLRYTNPQYNKVFCEIDIYSCFWNDLLCSPASFFSSGDLKMTRLIYWWQQM